MPQPSVTEISLKITYLNFCSNLPGANESTMYAIPWGTFYWQRLAQPDISLWIWNRIHINLWDAIIHTVQTHDDVVKWKHFPRYWSLVRGIHRAQRPVTRSFRVLVDLRLNKSLSKQSWGWWFETLSRLLWRHCNVQRMNGWIITYNWNLII